MANMGKINIKQLVVNNKIFLSILFLGMFLRLFMLGSIPVGLYVDEAAISVDAVSIAQTGKDIHGNSMFSAIFPSYGDYKLPVYVLFSAASVKLFGASEASIRFPSAVFGILTIIGVYILAKELFEKHKQKKRIALVASFFVAILPWDILFSRTGFEGHVSQAILLFSIIFMMLARKRPYLSILSGILGAVAVYTYYSTRFVFPVVYMSVFVLWFDKKHWKKYIAWFISGLVIFGLLLIPMMRSPLYARSQEFRLSAKSILKTQDQNILYANMLRAEDGNTIVSRVIHHRTLYFFKDLLKNYTTFFDGSYLFLTGDPNLRHGTGKTGIMLVSYLPFFVCGVYVLMKKQRKVGLFLFVWWMIALLPAAVPLELPHALRSLNGMSVLPLLCALGAVELYLWFDAHHVRRVGIYILTGVLFLNFFLFAFDYMKNYPTRSASAWFDGNKQVSEFIVKNKAEYDRVVVSGDEKMFLWVLFYGKYSGKQMQEFPSTRYWKLRFDNIEFGSDTLKSVASLEGKVLVIGMKDELTAFNNPLPIFGADGKPVYWYVVRERIQ